MMTMYWELERKVGSLELYSKVDFKIDVFANNEKQLMDFKVMISGRMITAKFNTVSHIRKIKLTKRKSAYTIRIFGESITPNDIDGILFDMNSKKTIGKFIAKWRYNKDGDVDKLFDSVGVLKLNEIGDILKVDIDVVYKRSIEYRAINYAKIIKYRYKSNSIKQYRVPIEVYNEF